jgi:1-acylglycerone phosphate reductase
MMQQQKVALVTGTSKGGIGDALAQEFHRRGLRVFATARNLDKVQHLRELGIETLPLDVESSASIQKTAEAVCELTGGRLDILVNNAGVGKRDAKLTNPAVPTG